MTDKPTRANYRSVMPSGVTPHVGGAIIVFAAPKMYDNNETVDQLIAHQLRVNPGADVRVLPPQNAMQFIMNTLKAEGGKGTTFSRVYFSAHGGPNSFNSMPHSNSGPEGDVDTRDLSQGIVKIQDMLRLANHQPNFLLTHQIFFDNCNILSNVTPSDLSLYSKTATELNATITASASVVEEHIMRAKLTGDFYDFAPDGTISHNRNFNNKPRLLKRDTDVDRSFHGLTGDSAACAVQKGIDFCQREQTISLTNVNQAIANLANGSGTDVDRNVDIILQHAQHLSLRVRMGAYMMAALSTKDPEKLTAAINGWETNINKLSPTERLDLIAERRDVALEDKIDPDNHKGTPLGDAFDRVAAKATSEAHGLRGRYGQEIAQRNARVARQPVNVFLIPSSH